MIRSVKSKGYAFQMEIIACARAQGYSIKEVTAVHRHHLIPGDPAVSEARNIDCAGAHRLCGQALWRLKAWWCRERAVLERVVSLSSQCNKKCGRNHFQLPWAATLLIRLGRDVLALKLGFFCSLLHCLSKCDACFPQYWFAGWGSYWLLQLPVGCVLHEKLSDLLRQICNKE